MDAPVEDQTGIADQVIARLLAICPDSSRAQAALQESGIQDKASIDKFHEILLIDAFVDRLVSRAHESLKKPDLPQVVAARQMFSGLESQRPAAEEGFVFPCTFGHFTPGKLYIFTNYICWKSSVNHESFQICFDDVTEAKTLSSSSVSTFGKIGFEISFQPSAKTLFHTDKFESPVVLHNFNLDLDSIHNVSIAKFFDITRMRDLALKVVLSRMEYMGKGVHDDSSLPSASSPIKQSRGADSVSDDDKRMMFEFSHKLIVSVFEFEKSGGFFSSLTSSFKFFNSGSKKQLLVIEQCDRCGSLLPDTLNQSVNLAQSSSPPPPPPVCLVLYDLRESDTTLLQDAQGNPVYEFDYKSTRTKDLKDAIDFSSRREIGFASDLELDVQSSQVDSAYAGAAGDFVIVFKSKSSNARVVIGAEIAEFSVEDSSATATRALHAFEMIATACLAGNPDILSPLAHQLLCVKVLGSARPENLGVSANGALRWITNAPRRLCNLWQPPTFKLSIFFSSTFTDTKRERAVIMNEIFPRLSERGQALGVQCVFTDMRWGVVDQNTLDQDTWDVCDAEIHRSERESCDIFFVSLQSEKYGYMPLPKQLPSSFAYHVSTLPEHVRKLFAAWYKQDLNDTPQARYHLQPLTDINDKPYWKVALPVLSQYLSGLKFDEPDLIVGRAVTEWEFRRATQIGSRNRMFWFKREFQAEKADDGHFWKDTQGKGKPNERFFCPPDERSKLDSLWGEMHAALGPNFLLYRPKFSEGFADKDKDGNTIQSPPPLESNFAKDAERLLGAAMDRVIAQKQRWSARAGGLIPKFGASSCTSNAELISEMLFHSEMARRICSAWWPGPSVVHSDDNILDHVVDKIVQVVNLKYNSASTGNIAVMSPVIALVGRPCSGKTAVMARVYARVLVWLHVSLIHFSVTNGSAAMLIRIQLRNLWLSQPKKWTKASVLWSKARPQPLSGS